jgi:class II aldolase/adducin N-terminal domain-containing protein
MTETGAIKFRAERLPGKMQPCSKLIELSVYRSKLRGLGFIGEDANGIGFGNVSIKAKKDEGFFITVSGGALSDSIDQGGLVFVKNWSLSDNFVSFEGPGTPSAETLTHAAVYEVNPAAGAILHIHNRALWERLVEGGEATGDVAEYGTTAMAKAVQKFLKRRGRLTTVLAMSGHEEGVIAFGQDLAEAYARLINLAAMRP